MIAAVVQMTSGADLARNQEVAAHWIARAAESGARLVGLPENFAYMAENDGSPNPIAQPLQGELLAFLADQAKRHGLWLAGGTLPERVAGTRKHHNTAVLLDPEGRLVAWYRKIHLFDAKIGDASYQESAQVEPGDSPVVADTPFGAIGLSVCYDVRFPELYRAQSARGAGILLVPAAFTVPSGEAHWEILVRARAIENQAFVLAPAQSGQHNASRRSFGHSMIVDPWGVVLASLPEGEGIALAELDPARQAAVREGLPALRHRRL